MAQDMQVGIIGMGLMGQMYARIMGDAGWRVNACDVPSKFDDLRAEFKDQRNIEILKNGHLVSRCSDWIIYNVEAEKIREVVAEYGQSTKCGAIVGGQTSCKGPEVAAFEEFIPEDVDIISCHSLHGPGVDPRGQSLAIIQHRDRRDSLEKVEHIMSSLGSKHVYLSAETHDRITADTQAVTHAAFLSMGTAWAANNQFPWEIGRYLGGIENVKINVTLRIYANKWHVYAGLAILNPDAKQQIEQYAKSATEIFKLMLSGQRDELWSRVNEAGDAVFKPVAHQAPLLNEELLNKFSLGDLPQARVRNNHLSLLAMVDCWWKLGIQPYEHMICSTPLFRMRLGAAEYLFRTPELLKEAIDTGIDDNTFRSDDLEFTIAARDWSQRVILGNFEGYREKFESVQEYFRPRFPDAVTVGNEMLKTILEKTN